jgi:hypothetical protein
MARRPSCGLPAQPAGSPTLISRKCAVSDHLGVRSPSRLRNGGADPLSDSGMKWMNSGRVLQSGGAAEPCGHRRARAAGAGR